MRENTAVISRNGTSTTIRFMKVVMSSSGASFWRAAGNGVLGHVGYADLAWRFAIAVMTLSALTEAISRLSTISPVLAVSTECVTSSGIADHQPEGGGVHRDRDAGRQQVGLLGRVGVGHRGERLDQADDRAEQAEQRRDVRGERDVRRALLELRDDLHHALFHRDLDVLAAPHRALPREAHAEQRETVESSLLVISRALSKSPLASAGCSLLHMLSFLRRTA
jgi:hypothetical protein